MRKSYIFELLIVSLAFAVSCDRNETPLEEPCDLIQIAASGEDVQTRGLLNMADLPTVDTKVKIYDYLTGFTGKIGEKSYTDGNVMYIEDEVKCVTAGTTAAPKGSWEFVTAPWRWTRTGTHHFFGWLTYDKKSALSLPTAWASFDNATRKLTVPAFTIADNTDQFDFSYSKIVTKTAPENVEIPLKHLFTALKVQVKNTIPTQLNDLSVSLSGIMNGRTATIDFSATPAEAGVTDVTAAYDKGALADFSLANAQTKTIPAAPVPTTETPNPVINPVALYTDNDGFRMLWPQDNLGQVIGATETEPGTPVSTATVKFKIGTDTYVNTLTGSLKDVFPDNKMEAGKKYVLTIIVSPIEIRFKVIVDPLDEYYYGRDDNPDDETTNDYSDYLIKL